MSGRQADSRIDGVDIQTQHRQTRSAELAFIHRRYIGPAQLDIRLAYRRGVPWFGGQWTAGSQGSPTFRYGITTLDASLNLPFQALAQHWLWTSELRAQAPSTFALLPNAEPSALEIAAASARAFAASALIPSSEARALACLFSVASASTSC